MTQEHQVSVSPTLTIRLFLSVESGIEPKVHPLVMTLRTTTTTIANRCEESCTSQNNNNNKKRVLCTKSFSIQSSFISFLLKKIFDIVPIKINK